MAVTKQQALDYHFGERPGKIEVTSSKPCRTQRDLSLAYTPGVAIPCLEIEKNPQDALQVHRARATWWRSSATGRPCSAWATLEPWRASP